MRAIKTGHEIADTVSDTIGDLPDFDGVVAYGILRGTKEAFARASHWFELDRGYWGAKHFDGNYRIAYKDMQPQYDPDMPKSHHETAFEPWIKPGSGRTLICPPTVAVCEFYGLTHTDWVWDAVLKCRDNGWDYEIRDKFNAKPLTWDGVDRVITFNSAVGWEGIQRGVPCISSEDHSLVGSFTKAKKTYCEYDRYELFSCMAGHQFKLGDKEKICRIVNHYIAHSAKDLSMTH